MSLVSANIRKKITANYTMQRQRNPGKPAPLRGDDIFISP